MGKGTAFWVAKWDARLYGLMFPDDWLPEFSRLLRQKMRELALIRKVQEEVVRKLRLHRAARDQVMVYRRQCARHCSPIASTTIAASVTAC